MANKTQYKVLVSFAAKGRSYRKGELITLPSGTDWVKAGFVKRVPKRTAKAK